MKNDKNVISLVRGTFYKKRKNIKLRNRKKLGLFKRNGIFSALFYGNEKHNRSRHEATVAPEKNQVSQKKNLLVSETKKNSFFAGTPTKIRQFK